MSSVDHLMLAPFESRPKVKAKAKITGVCLNESENVKGSYFFHQYETDATYRFGLCKCL